MNLLLILLGGGLGALLRAAITDFVAYFQKSTYPIATIIVNIFGSSLIGLLGGVMITHTPIHALFIVGFLGGLTTFSTVQLDLVQMLHKRQYVQFLSYSLLQYIGCFVCCYIGAYIL